MFKLDGKEFFARSTCVAFKLIRHRDAFEKHRTALPLRHDRHTSYIGLALPTPRCVAFHELQGTSKNRFIIGMAFSDDPDLLAESREHLISKTKNLWKMEKKTWAHGPLASDPSNRYLHLWP
jgi:hypothetical protein